MQCNFCKDLLVNENDIERLSCAKCELQNKNMNLYKIHEKLEEVHIDVKRLIVMLEPVHSHAEWVDGLRSRLHSIGLMRNTPRIE